MLRTGEAAVAVLSNEAAPAVLSGGPRGSAAREILPSALTVPPGTACGLAEASYSGEPAIRPS
jgi:hypothetical protein